MRDFAGEPAMLAGQGRAFDGRNERAVLRRQVARELDDRGVALALVDDFLDVGPADQRRLGRERPVQHHALVSQHHHPLVDAERRIGQPSHPTKRGGERRERGEIFLVDELELALIQRIHAKSDTERIKHAIARAKGRANVRRPVGHDLFVVQCHRLIRRA